MVMEYLEGSDLKKVVSRRGPFLVEEVVAYALQACDALVEAHAKGIIHRDIKPSNLFLIRRPNGSPCVKVLDFGISKIISTDGGDLTSTGAMLGSPLYMPPEQILNAKNVDARSDVWAMGVVLYELVTGKLPFESPGDALSEEPPSPSWHRPELPGWVDAVVARCLQKAPDRRFQSIDDLAAALRSEGEQASNANASIALADTVPERPAPPSSSGDGAGSTTLSDATIGRTGQPPPAPRVFKARSLGGLVIAAAAVVLGVMWLVRQRSPDVPAPAQPADSETTALGTATGAPLESAAEGITPPIAPPETSATPAPTSSAEAAAPKPAALPVRSAKKPAASPAKPRSSKPGSTSSAARPATPPEPIAPPAPPAPPVPLQREGVF